MMIRCFFVAACTGLAVAPQQACAYDAETHGLIMYKGYEASRLPQVGVGSIRNRLGLDRLDVPTVFNAYWLAAGTELGPTLYYDNLDVQPRTLNIPRAPHENERCKMQHLRDARWIPDGDVMLDPAGKVAFFPLQNWLIRGDLREDDLDGLGYFFASEKCGDPDPDPWNPIMRVLNHFYDPIHDVALTSNGCTVLAFGGVCRKSVDWALGYVDSFAASPNVETTRRNHFTYVDARENEWLALTGERGRSAPPYTAAARAADAEERFYRWATAFKSLGNAIHLLQDGAQPQHVRNDAHNPQTSEERQAFEGYTNARVLKESSSSDQTKFNSYVRAFFSATGQVELPDMPIGSYAPSMFATPLRFFTTRQQGDGAAVLPDSRLGMMDYANRGFFTGGSRPGATGNTFLRPSSTLDAANGYSVASQPCALAHGGPRELQSVSCVHVTHAVPDSVVPSYADTLPTGFSQPPLLVEGAFKFADQLYGIQRQEQFYVVGVEEFQTMANLAIPRAIGYTAGFLNFFFRGQLAVTAPPSKIVAVLNQGAQHTMNAQGYPCVGTATNDGCPIFGFNSIRVSVQNVTGATPPGDPNPDTAPHLIESGTNVRVAQNMSDTATGDIANPNFQGPYLVAVARYHRNSCYKPDLTGEPYQIYNYTPPSTGITQPTCAPGQTTRTPYQEIAVSKSLAATSAQLNGTSPFEAHFDFSADPIPVNATDLFIQVVYRGPMGDSNFQEPDAIAVGTLDVREPTFGSFWNNTDYFNTGGAWSLHNALYPNEGVRDFWACAGGAPVKLIYEYYGGPSSGAMIDPITGSNVPGQVRLGIIFPPPDFVGQGKSLRGTPVTYPGIPGTKQIPLRSPYVGSGQFRQANLENVSAATLNLPNAGCASSLPISAQYWCFDPIQKRRNQLFGTPAQPLYLEPSFASSPPDVDANAPPAPLPAFAGTVPWALGTIRFDTDTTLVNCPTQPAQTLPTTSADQDYLHWIELLEEARDLGVSGEAEAPLQQEVPH